METYLLGKDTGAEISQRDLEAACIVIIENLDDNQSLRTDRTSRGGWSSHDADGRSDEAGRAKGVRSVTQYICSFDGVVTCSTP